MLSLSISWVYLSGKAREVMIMNFDLYAIIAVSVASVCISLIIKLFNLLLENKRIKNSYLLDQQKYLRMYLNEIADEYPGKRDKIAQYHSIMSLDKETRDRWKQYRKEVTKPEVDKLRKEKEDILYSEQDIINELENIRTKYSSKRGDIEKLEMHIDAMRNKRQYIIEQLEGTTKKYDNYTKFVMKKGDVQKLTGGSGAIKILKLASNSAKIEHSREYAKEKYVYDINVGDSVILNVYRGNRGGGEDILLLENIRDDNGKLFAEIIFKEIQEYYGD